MFFACQEIWYIPVKTFAFDKSLFFQETVLFPNLFQTAAGEKVYGFLSGKKKKKKRTMDLIWM